MKTIVYSQEAGQNLKKIYDHTKRNFSKEKAEGVVKLIFENVTSLQKFPYLGKTSSISELVRELVVEGNVIYYQISEETIDVVFIKPRKNKPSK